jgi:predicted phosphoribosyltransferase
MKGFRDRAEAGRALGAALRDRLPDDVAVLDVVVLGLARGGVPVAAEVARAINAPLDVCVVRKLGDPAQPEFAFGAIAEDEGGFVEFIDDATARELRLDESDVDRVRQTEAAELARRARAYRGGRPMIDVRTKHVVLVDDGLATGATMRAAIRLVKRRGAASITVAVPVGAPDTAAGLSAEAEVVCALAPDGFFAVGPFYDDFNSPTDDEIRSAVRDRGTQR